MKIDPNSPAFPHTHIIGINGMLHDAQSVGGLPIRLHLAAMAMQGLCASGSDYEKFSHIAHDAMAIADALIAEYNRTEESAHAK